MTENSVTDTAAEARKLNIARWTATVFGLLGFVLSVSIPLLPVKVSTATLDWPQQGRLNNVTAPLISQTPMDMTVIVPCAVVNSAPADGAVILGTAPPEGKEAALQSLLSGSPRSGSISPTAMWSSRASRAPRSPLPTADGSSSPHRIRAPSLHSRGFTVTAPRSPPICAADSPIPTCAHRLSGSSPSSAGRRPRA